MHALAYSLGKRGVPHGVANSLLFTAVMENTLPDPISMIPNYEALCQLIASMPIPDISRYPVSILEAADMAQEAMEQKRLLVNHPASISKDCALKIFEKLF